MAREKEFKCEGNRMIVINGLNKLHPYLFFLVTLFAQVLSSDEPFQHAA